MNMTRDTMMARTKRQKQPLINKRYTSLHGRLAGRIGQFYFNHFVGVLRGRRRRLDGFRLLLGLRAQNFHEFRRDAGPIGLAVTRDEVEQRDAQPRRQFEDVAELRRLQLQQEVVVR